jgi:hypothetical protein
MVEPKIFNQGINLLFKGVDPFFCGHLAMLLWRVIKKASLVMESVAGLPCYSREERFSCVKEALGFGSTVIAKAVIPQLGR